MAGRTTPIDHSGDRDGGLQDHDHGPLRGLKFALPLSLLLWALIAYVIWVLLH